MQAGISQFCNKYFLPRNTQFNIQLLTEEVLQIIPFFKFGIRRIIRLTRFEIDIEQVVKKYRTANDGYLMAFATRTDKQGQHYGKSLMEAILNHLDASGESCYLETLNAENVALYEHFSFQLKAKTAAKLGNLTIFAMQRLSGREASDIHKTT